MTQMGAGRDIGFVSNQMNEAAERAQKQLDAVKDGLHGKIEDHLGAVITTMATLEQTVLGAIGISQEERRIALQSVSDQLDAIKKQQSEDAASIRTAIYTIESNLKFNTQTLVQNAETNLRRDFWKLFFVSLWRSIKGLF